MPTATELKAQIDANIGNQTGANSITPAILATQLKAIIDFVDAVEPTGELIVHDTFTDTNGVAITAHTKDLGSAWVSMNGELVGDFTIGSNKVLSFLDAAAARAYYTESGLIDCKITVDAWFGNGTVKVLGRVFDLTNYFYFSLDATTIAIYKVVSGSPTLLDSVSVSPVVGTSYPLEVTFEGNDITYKGLGQTLTANDVFSNESTKHGIEAYQPGSTAHSFDNFKIYSL